MRIKVSTALLAGVWLLAGCARLAGGGGYHPSPSPAVTDLAGTWVLDTARGPDGPITVPAGWSVTLTFEEDRVSGQACNIYGGDYTLDPDGTISFSAMSMTDMACQEPMMGVEAAYHAALALVDHVEVRADRLTLTGTGVELTYARQQPTPDAALVGTDWVLDTVIQGDVAASVVGEPTLQVGADGRLHGSTGCRGFDGAYALDGDRVTVSDLLTTSNPCTQENAGQDGQVLAVIEGPFTFAIDGDRLTLTAGSQGLVYRAAA